MKAGFVSTVLKTASIAAVPFVMLAASVPAAAQGGQRMLFEWRGQVDQEVRIQMQNGRTDVIAMGPRESIGYDNARAVSSVPSINGYVSVRMLEGRGIADVVQQPRARNGYITIVRIRDRQSGRGQYDIQAFWQPDGRYGNVYNDRAYNDGYSNYYPNYDPNYDPNYNSGYDPYYNDRYGAYGAYGAYGGNYGNYPRTVIVERPVQRPVYVERRAQPRSFRVPPVVVVNPPRDAARRGAIPPGFPVPHVPASRAPTPHAVRTVPPPSQSYHHTDGYHRDH